MGRSHVVWLGGPLKFCVSGCGGVEPCMLGTVAAEENKQSPFKLLRGRLCKYYNYK